MTKDLFRKEAVRHRTRALYGDVVLANPKMIWVMTTLLAISIVCVICICLFGHVDVDGVSTPIWQWATNQS